MKIVNKSQLNQPRQFRSKKQKTWKPPSKKIADREAKNRKFIKDFGKQPVRAKLVSGGLPELGK